MPKIFTSGTQTIGKIGEDIACRFLREHGYEIVERNYTKKWGEIDVVARKEKRFHFVEVKAVSYENLLLKGGEVEVPSLADRVHQWKAQRLARTIQTYLLERRVGDDAEWQFDIYFVFLDLKDKKPKVKVLEDVVL